MTHAAATQARRIPHPTPEPEAAALVRGVEVLIRKLAAPEAELPLHLIERFERALHAGHQANLLRLSAIAERALTRIEEE